MRLLYIHILLAISVNSFSQMTFEERKADSSEKKIDSILIIGAGPSITRAFLENVSEYIIKGCAKKNVVAKYNYIGNDLDNSKKDYDTINKIGYKAILFLLPKSVANFESQTFSHQNILNTPAGTLVTTSTTTSLTYSQGFSFQLCTPLDNMKKIWIASVGVAIDPGKKETAKKVAKNVLSSFKEHNYLQ